ncbi:GTPase IMAP family member 7-like [Littorina saxatilis]|uniref:GTPase IMAP family member 7-like n=1 Tax=Littorina saxatilis TaxID=31220 RepID=UPI0038B452E1
MHPGPNAILYVVKVGRYTDEEFRTYARLKSLFDDDVIRHMIVVFTGGDELEKHGKTIDDVVAAAPENLKTVLEECEYRHVTFSNYANDESKKSQVEQLLRMVQSVVIQNDNTPYSCPKYSVIGNSMEEEVARRLEAAEKKELEGKMYVQKLQRQKDEMKKEVIELEERVKLLKGCISESSREKINEKNGQQKTYWPTREDLKDGAQNNGTTSDLQNDKKRPKPNQDQEPNMTETGSKNEDIAWKEGKEQGKPQAKRSRRDTEHKDDRNAKYHVEMKRMKERVVNREEPTWMGWAVMEVSSALSGVI